MTYTHSAISALCDAQADFASAAERTVAPGRCTLCEEDSPELVPWSGERLCWNCTDRQLDLLALAVGPEFEELLAA